MAVEVRPATANDFLEMRQSLPPVRVRAFAGVEDGKVIALGGIGYNGEGRFQVFFDLSEDEARKRYPIALVKTAKRILVEAKEAGIPRVIARCDRRIPEAERFLLWLGFTPISPGSDVFYWG